MAESGAKSVRKATRKRRFKKLNPHLLPTAFDSESGLQSILRSIAFGRHLWRRLVDDASDDASDDATDDADDTRPQDFLGFGAPSAPPPEPPLARPAPANRIQELLQRRWAQRIRELSDEKPIKEKKNEIIRKAKLEINSKTLQRIRRAHEWPLARPNAEPTRSGQPGFITCAICASTKYYAHVQRRYGVFSCEPCSKFFARFIKEPKQFLCARAGDCPIAPPEAGARPNVAGSRCRACWLKVCLQKFQMDADLRATLARSFGPKLAAPAHQMALITVDTTPEPTTPVVTSGTTPQTTHRQPLLMVAAAGPRVKRVCRSAGIVSGLPVATFGPASADEDSDELPVDVYLCRKVAETRARRKGVKSA